MLTTSIKQTKGMLFTHLRCIYNRNKVMDSYNTVASERRHNFILQKMKNEDEGIFTMDAEAHQVLLKNKAEYDELYKSKENIEPTEKI
jgi:hypothetical protein